MAGVHSGIYDFFRVAYGMIVECWNTVSPIAPRGRCRSLPSLSTHRHAFNPFAG